ncbi:carboxypeptidase-like regulatory domain-containing protein [Robiginitalea sp. M366]|uniref:carboxypeptidase-like regulatory domain-containing protein n=1 Tax=Robiginitalea aestuariiviva TaxID=3036903 RepID=UPI00240D1488|nr:carboxypeptidase-like regulatory domain-containing protein [Robiginitalea aestuariiviva]MDG1570787.1 carboxypeptidase-like regulatory domain-containing protein [Robiginitalea aestuariiviva]
MQKVWIWVLACLWILPVAAQDADADRPLLRGTVLYRNSPVPNENVINSTAGLATITDERGEFAIPARLGDELVFMALNYELKVVTVDAPTLQRNRLVVEVNEKVTQLDEVTVSPEDQQEFLRLQNEEFKQFDYEPDATSEVINIAEDPTVRGMQNGLNFVNLFKLLTGTYKKSAADEGPTLKMSDVLRQIYDDAFFIRDLRIPPERIADFLTYCDAQLPPRSLLRKENEFELIDFLVNQSEAFHKTLE